LVAVIVFWSFPPLDGPLARVKTTRREWPGARREMRMRGVRHWVVFGALLLVVGCAAGPNGLEGTPDVSGQVAGFWVGLWHGMISPITFVVSLFKDSVHFYEVHNNGPLYSLGFLLGAGILGGGGGVAARSK